MADTMRQANGLEHLIRLVNIMLRAVTLLLFFSSISLHFAYPELVRGDSCQQSDHSQVINTRPRVFAPKLALTALSDVHTDGNRSHASYSFGAYNLLEDPQQSLDAEDSRNMKPVFPGIKHVFRLKNQTSKPLRIKTAESNCFCSQVRVVVKESLREFPYTVAPGAEVKVAVAIDQHAPSPGPVLITTELIGTSSENPLAILTMKGDLQTGIRFSPGSLDWGTVASGAGKSLPFAITLHRSINLHVMPGAKMLLASTNPNIRITAIPPVQKFMGLIASGNTINFPNGVVDFPRDLKLTFRAELLKTAPLGAINGRIRLTLPKYPLFMLLDKAEVPVRGNVAGHMRVEPSGTLVLGSTPAGSAVETIAKVAYLPPLTADSLRVVSSGKYVTAQFVQLEDHSNKKAEAPPDARSSTTWGERQPTSVAVVPDTQELKWGAVKMSVGLSAQAPIGTHDCILVVTNSVNSERLELRIYASVIK